MPRRPRRRIASPCSSQQTRRTFQIGEQERHRPTGQLGHPILLGPSPDWLVNHAPRTNVISAALRGRSSDSANAISDCNPLGRERAATAIWVLRAIPFRYAGLAACLIGAGVTEPEHRTRHNCRSALAVTCRTGQSGRLAIRTRRCPPGGIRRAPRRPQRPKVGSV